MSKFLPIGKATPPPPGFDGLCERHIWACVDQSESAFDGSSLLEIARRINHAVNASIHQISDRIQYGQDEYWELPSARGGDCEDLALLKKLRLIAAGVPAGRLLIATVLDRKIRPHAVLVVRSDDGDLVLDSARGRVMPWHETGYSFVRIQHPNAPKRWNAVLTGGIFKATPAG